MPLTGAASLKTRCLNNLTSAKVAPFHPHKRHQMLPLQPIHRPRDVLPTDGIDCRSDKLMISRILVVSGGTS